MQYFFSPSVLIVQIAEDWQWAEHFFVKENPANISGWVQILWEGTDMFMDWPHLYVGLLGTFQDGPEKLC